MEMAFNSAVERINSHGLAEPGERYIPTPDRLLTRVEHIERADSFQASRKGQYQDWSSSFLLPQDTAYCRLMAALSVMF